MAADPVRVAGQFDLPEYIRDVRVLEHTCRLPASWRYNLSNCRIPSDGDPLSFIPCVEDWVDHALVDYDGGLLAVHSFHLAVDGSHRVRRQNCAGELQAVGAFDLDYVRTTLAGIC